MKSGFASTDTSHTDTCASRRPTSSVSMPWPWNRPKDVEVELPPLIYGQPSGHTSFNIDWSVSATNRKGRVTGRVTAPVTDQQKRQATALVGRRPWRPVGDPDDPPRDLHDVLKLGQIQGVLPFDGFHLVVNRGRVHRPD